ncbi:MAG TPA: hypothetical protein VMT60_03345 [Candidatus Bathyarchaeia archaeon]|nr:hypothetical protein [Candidatus Bathyarchaeia archaeon]
MKDIPKNMIGFSGKHFVQSMLMREGLPTAAGEGGIDLVVNLKKPRREFSIFVVSNLQPKRAGGKGKEALDWWIPLSTTADIIACADLSTLRVWLFERDELPKFAQQKTSSKYHLYMYTDKAVALRGKKSMKFDYEYEPFKLENRVYQGIFERRSGRGTGKVAKRRPRRRRAARSARRKGAARRRK